MSAHTPGPWSIGSGYFQHYPGNEQSVLVSARRATGKYIKNGQGQFVEEYCSGERIATVCTKGGALRGDEGMANARLIAAAPDLLNALRVLANAAESLGIPVDAARAAIAKATGEQS